MSKNSGYLGYTVVTRSMLDVRDHSIYPPDRPLATYKVRQGNNIVEVIGTWGDYLRDVDSGIVIKEYPPLTKEEAVNGEMVISDIASVNGKGVAPDRPFLVDPLRSFA